RRLCRARSEARREGRDRVEHERRVHRCGTPPRVPARVCLLDRSEDARGARNPGRDAKTLAMSRWLGLLALAACSSAPPATADFFGPTIEPPRGLLWVHPGMSAKEAMRLVPGLHPDEKGVRDELILDSGVGDVRLAVRLDAGTVSGIVAIVLGHTARDLLTRAWGPPEITKDSLGQPEITWASEATGWKVKLDCLERNCLVEYEPYHVLTAEFFGTHVIPPGDLAKLRIGMKLAEARK